MTQKKQRLQLPKHISYSLVVQPERKIVLTYSGVKVSLEDAETIIDFLFSLSGSRYRKPLGQSFDREDIYPNIKKLISNGSLTKIQAKYICMNYCSEYVWNTEIAS